MEGTKNTLLNGTTVGPACMPLASTGGDSNGTVVRVLEMDTDAGMWS